MLMIDWELRRRQIKHLLYEHCINGRITKRLLKDQFNDLNNVEPVKHGHWIVISEYPKKAECSYCGYLIEHELVCWWDYCPNCGARMNEVEE